MAVSKVSKTTTAKDATKDTTKKAVQTTLKVEDAKKVEPAKAEPAKKTVAKKPATTKTTAAKKPAAKKTTRKPAAKKEAVEVKADVFVQIYGNEYSEKEIMKKVVAAWEAEGKKASAIKRVKLYIKPEEGKAYYVINDRLKNGSTGAVDL